jgi:hypothetical protein
VKKLPKFDDQNIDLPYGISVQKGIVDNFSGIQKFGYNASVGSSFETIWTDGSNLYVYPTTATTAVATSSSTDDNGSTVHVFGLDENFDLADEVITVGGSASTTTFIRMHRAFVASANTGVVNVGNITVTVDSKTVAYISAGYGQTLQSIYTIPRNYRGYLMSFDIGNSKDVELEAKIMARPINGNTFQTKAFQTIRGGAFRKEYLIPEVFTEKTDIEMRAKASATSSVSGGFELLLEDVTYSA